MSPFVVIFGLTILIGLGAGIPAFVILKLARLKASGALAPGGEVGARLESLEHDVQNLQQTLAETQERLDFAERLLTKPKQE